MNIPKGHQAVMPYLMLEGAQRFIEFTQQVFDAAVTFTKMRDDNSTIMHSEIQISGSTIMFCEATTEWKREPGNLFVYVEDADESFKKALEAGAEKIMDLRDESYGRVCGVSDPCGNIWWITAVKN